MDDADLKLAEALVRDGILPQAVVDRARRVQERVKQPLDHVLVALDLVSRTEVDRLLAHAQGKLSLLDRLVERGALETDEVACLRRDHPGRADAALARDLVDRGRVNENLFLELESEISGTTLLDEIPADRVRELPSLPAHTLRKHQAVLFENEKGELTLAVADPGDQEILNLFRSKVPGGGRLVLARRASIAAALAALERSRATPPPGSKDAPATAGHVISGASARTTDPAGIADYILAEADRRRASDIHVEPFRNRVRVRLRIDGELMQLAEYPSSITKRLTSRLKVLAGMDIADTRRHQDGRMLLEVNGKMIDVRVSGYVSLYGENLVMRLLRQDTSILDVTQIGMGQMMMADFKQLAFGRQSGIVIITGPTGSGKTTTLYACIRDLNRMERKIITAEDPAEYTVDGVVQCSINPKAGVCFEDTLRSIVRQDPDVIVLGEMRDRFSAETAVQAALTGHQVFTTFHTEDSVGALIRLADMEIQPFLIASTISCVLAQRLVRKVCDHCRVPYVPSVAETQRFNLNQRMVADFEVVRGKGCEHCSHTGYRGRIGIFELLPMTDAVREAVLGRSSSSRLRSVCRREGLVTLAEDGLAKVLRGLTTFTEIIRWAPYTEEMLSTSEILERVG
jgi:type IV pilus assembly protein PilB